MSLSIRCEQGTQDNSLDVWLGRFAMIGFAVAITVEITNRQWTFGGMSHAMGF